MAVTTRKARALLAFWGIFAVLLSVVMIAPSSARADGCDKGAALQNYGPDSGVVFAHRLSGNAYSASLNFVLTTEQVNNLRCLGAYLEIDFRLHESGLPGNWENYSTFSNMIGATHDTSARDESPQPAVTGIRTGYINPNQTYYAGIYWTQSGLPADMKVSVHWTPQYLAGFRGEVYPESAFEAYLCATADVLNWPYEFAYCTFGVKNLTGEDEGFDLSKHFFPGQPEGKLPFTSIVACYGFGGWGCAGEKVSESGTPPANAIVDNPVAGQPLYQGYVPDGMIVQNTSGSNLYSAAGGRLFWFNQSNAALREALLTQRRQRYGEIPFLVMADEDIHAVEVNRDNNGTYVPGAHMPADNTFLYEYGNPTQYVIKYQHPFAIGSTAEVTALGGADRAVMVPTSISDLQQYPAQWVQNDLLQFYGEPTVWHYAGDRGFRVPSVPTRDCLSVRHHRGVTLMPGSAWNAFPTHPTQQAACDFAHGQVLVGQPSQRQAIVLYGAGFAIGSPEEAVAIGAANLAAPVADETVDGLLARTPNIPQGHVFRAGLQTQAYHYVNATFSPIGSPATRDCLLARDGLGTGEEVVPGSFIAKYPVGNPAYCELENRQLLAPNGVNVSYIKDGYRRPVANPAIRDCIAVRAGAGQPVQVSDNVWNSYTAGANAYCPYEREPGLNFVKDPAYPDIVWLVGPATGNTPGVKRHAGSLCVPDPYTTPIKAAHVFTVPAHETDGHVQGADWWPSSADCQALPQG